MEDGVDDFTALLHAFVRWPACTRTHIGIAGIFKKNGFKQVILAPIINGGELVGFVGLDVPNKIITDLDSVRTVATIIYSELLKRKETDELSRENVSYE